MEIDEMIADARVEEEITKEQAKDQFTTDVYKALSSNLRNDTKVTIPLHEYISLKYSDRDLTILLGSILEDLKLDYDGKGLCVGNYGDSIINTLKLLFRPIYDAALQEKKEEGDK